MTVANTLNVPIKTARRIIKSEGRPACKRGGSTKLKINEQMKEEIIENIEKDPTVGLQDHCDYLKKKFGVTISPQRIGQILHGMCFSVEIICIEPSAMNNVFNKEKRREFCTKLLESRNTERMVGFVHETTFNIHISRTKGWAKKGQRAVVKIHSRKAPNLNVMCTISSYQRACINFETKRGSVTKEVFTEFIKRTVLNCFEVLDEVNEATGITIVFDNAPCHNGVEDSLQDEEYLQSGRVQLLRLGPYSPQ